MIYLCHGYRFSKNFVTNFTAKIARRGDKPEIDEQPLKLTFASDLRHEMLEAELFDQTFFNIAYLSTADAVFQAKKQPIKRRQIFHERGSCLAQLRM